MIIEAKANRQANQPADPHEKLEFNAPEKLSRLPVYVALLLTGLAAYIRSAFPAQARADAPADTSDTADHTPSVGRPHTHALQDGHPASGRPAADDVAPASPVHAGPDSMHHNEAAASSGFQMPDPVSFAYATPMFELFGPQVAAHFPVAFGYRPLNDNAPVLELGPQGQSPPMAKLALPSASEVAPPRDDDDEDDDDEDEDEDDEDDGDGQHPQAAANRAPMAVGPVQLHDVFAGQVVLIGLSELLFGSSDEDGDALTVTGLSASAGTLAPSEAGWLLTIQPGMVGPISFTYEIGDGLHLVGQTATLQVVRHDLRLTAGDDVFVGTPYDDDIAGRAGDDTIDAGAGNDRVVGGRGADYLDGGDGDDQLLGGPGDDVIFGGSGNDVIGGGPGNDRLFGGAGDDILDGDGGDDILLGGDGDDILNGGAGDDTLDGGSGNDVLFGGVGNDRLSGGAGDDIINGEDGDDIVLGDAGNDLIDGGEGYDVLDYSAFTAPIRVDFDAGTACSAEIDEDQFIHIEQVVGGQGDDVFIVGATAAVISGGRGNDLFIFTVIDDAPALSHQLVHEILDFLVGDRIQVADYEISRRAERLEEERFEQFYDDLDSGFETGLPIRVTHSFYDDMDHTIIEADTNGDNFYEIAISLHGVSLPLQLDSHFA